MSIENILLFGSLLSLLTVIILSFMYSKRFALINGAIFIAYISYMIYSVFHQNQGGATLIWWFYLVVFAGIQLMIMIGYVLTNWLRNNKEANSNSSKISVFLIGFVAIFWGLTSLISHYPYAYLSIITGILSIGLSIIWFVYEKYKS